MWAAIASIIIWLIGFFLKDSEDEEEDSTERQPGEKNAWELLFGGDGFDLWDILKVAGLGYLLDPAGMDKLTDKLADTVSNIIGDVGETVTTVFDQIWKTIQELMKNPLTWVVAGLGLWWWLGSSEDEEEEVAIVTEDGDGDEVEYVEYVDSEGRVVGSDVRPVARPTPTAPKPVSAPAPIPKDDSGGANEDEVSEEYDAPDPGDEDYDPQTDPSAFDIEDYGLTDEEKEAYGITDIDDEEDDWDLDSDEADTYDESDHYSEPLFEDEEEDFSDVDSWMSESSDDDFGQSQDEVDDWDYSPAEDDMSDEWGFGDSDDTESGFDVSVDFGSGEDNTTYEEGE